MKFNYILKILFPFFLCAGCSSENPVENNFNGYNGTWLWLKTVGGIMGRVIVPENGVTVEINYDSFNTFRLLRNDSLKVIAHYKIDEEENGTNKISYSDIITYNYNFDVDMEFANIRSDTLEIWDGIIDGYFRFYKKNR